MSQVSEPWLNPHDTPPLPSPVFFCLCILQQQLTICLNPCSNPLSPASWSVTPWTALSPICLIGPVDLASILNHILHDSLICLSPGEHKNPLGRRRRRSIRRATACRSVMASCQCRPPMTPRCHTRPPTLQGRQEYIPLP
jgi:hypothetical protein